MSNGLITRQELGQDLKEGFDKINVLTALPTTTGIANTYSVTIAGLSDLIPGLKVTVKFHQASNGASTLNINEFGAIGIIKPGGGSPNLKAGIYTLVYDGVNFQLQGEGGEYGTALAGDVLTGKTIGTEDGVISGTMPNRGAVNITPSQVDQTIVNGFHNGTGKVLKVPVPVANVLTGTTIAGAAGTMPNRGALNQTITSNNGQINISSGYYTGGIIKAIFTNLVAENIKKGVNIGGVVGNLVAMPQSIEWVTFNNSKGSKLIAPGETARIEIYDGFRKRSSSKNYLYVINVEDNYSSRIAIAVNNDVIFSESRSYIHRVTNFSRTFHGATDESYITFYVSVKNNNTSTIDISIRIEEYEII